MASPPESRLTCTDHKPIIDVSNVYAGAIATKHKVGSDEFHARFAEGFKLFDETDYDESSLDDGGTTGVTRVHLSLFTMRK